MSETAKVWNHRALNEDEFAVLKTTPTYLQMMTNRLRMTVPTTQVEGRAAVNEITNWLHTNCNHLYHVRASMIGRLDILFINENDAAGFKLVWSGRQYEPV